MTRSERGTLEAIGVSESEEVVYRSLLDGPGMSPSEIAATTALSPRDIQRLLTALENKGLVSRSPSKPARFAATSPDVALEVLVLRREEELERIRLAARRLQDRFQLGKRRTSPMDLVEVVIGAEAIGQRFMQLQRAAKHEVLGFDTPPYIMRENKDELELLQRGIKYRVLYDRKALEMVGRWDYLSKLIEAGEEARSTPDLPMKLIIADRSVALVPLHIEEPGMGVLVVHASPLLEAISLLFETLWQRAAAIEIDPEGSIRPDASPGGTLLSEADRRILALLAAGVQDGAIARQMGLGLRTVTRRIGRLMEMLGAETRFQAGLHAAGRGWLHPPVE